MMLKSSLLLLPVALSLGVSSCAGPGNAGYGGFNSYSTLPGNYNGSACYHNGRYYTGGNYQTGTCSHQGKTYSSRYSHNGKNYYGGSHQHYSSQQGGSHSSSLSVNTPVIQEHSSSQLLQRRH